MEEPDKNNSIDSAIEACNKTISTHRRASNLILIGVLFTLFGFFSYFLFIYQESRSSYQSRLNELYYNYKELESWNDSLLTKIPAEQRSQLYYPRNLNAQLIKPETTSSSNFINYGIYLFGIVVISILTALYRLHLKEISKAEQNLIALYRIRIAGNNYSDGFSTEVRKALTENAFYAGDGDKGLFNRTKKVESPVPGHPGSDLVTLVVNKLLENVEIKPKQ